MLTQLDRWAVAAAADYSEKVRADSVARNDATIVVRRTTLERTYHHRINKRRALLAAASDPRIKRLRSGEITNLEAELRNKIADIESRREVGVSFTPVAAGILKFKSGAQSKGSGFDRSAVSPTAASTPQSTGRSAHDEVMMLLGGRARHTRD